MSISESVGRVSGIFSVGRISGILKVGRIGELIRIRVLIQLSRLIRLSDKSDEEGYGSGFTSGSCSFYVSLKIPLVV